MNRIESSPIWFGATLALVGLIVGYIIGFGMGMRFQPVGNSAQILAEGGEENLPEDELRGPLAPIDEEEDHVRGDLGNARFALIEYSDFECPFCQSHHPTMKDLADEYGEDMAWVYRHYPLPFHPTAQPKAEASECVAKLGGNKSFWSFADAIFEDTSKNGVSEEDLPELAKAAGVNEAAFKKCLESGEMADKVQQQMDDGTTAGIDGTPGTVFINLETDETKLISGAVPFDDMVVLIDGYLGE